MTLTSPFQPKVFYDSMKRMEEESHSLPSGQFLLRGSSLWLGFYTQFLSPGGSTRRHPLSTRRNSER